MYGQGQVYRYYKLESRVLSKEQRMYCQGQIYHKRRCQKIIERGGCPESTIREGVKNTLRGGGGPESRGNEGSSVVTLVQLLLLMLFPRSKTTFLFFIFLNVVPQGCLHFVNDMSNNSVYF